MIKFWKSAAKGKSGCPVRPPEQICANNTTTNILLDTDLCNESNEHHTSNIFEKKSKLSLSIYDVLIEHQALKYFVLFMETIGKHLLIKCWVEMDNFKSQMLHLNSNESEKHAKLSHTKSLDIHCKCSYFKNNCENSFTHKNHWRASTSNLKQSKMECSTSSCKNLNEYSNYMESCDRCENTENVNITEQAINLFKKYIALEAPCHLDVPDAVRKLVISNICQPEGQIKEDCFKPVHDILFNQMETSYFNDFLNSPFYIKAQIDVLTNGSLNLKDLLYNETILFYFTEYLEQEGCSVLLECLMAMMHFRDNLTIGSTTGSEAQSDAIVLYDKYFSLQATSPIGFPTEIRLKVESDICREEGPLVTCFDQPYKIVFKTLSNCVKNFLESELYYTYLSEMIHSVDHVWTSKFKSHSDCSSEFSISTQNTLLAMGDLHFKKKRNNSVPDMTIDSNQLYNADALWQRKKHDGLSLGRINSLGRFESKFEPDPDKKDKSVLKKMVSKLVPTSTSKVEEEMAWQIAHMIVKDVTDLTMAPPDNDHDDV